MEVLEFAVKESKIFRIDGRSYKLLFPLPVVVELEAKLGRSMKTWGDWFAIETKEVQTILEAGFSHNHPDEAEEAAALVCDALDPEEIGKVIDYICAAACPKVMARVQAEIEKAQERAKKGLPPLPNAPGADAS